MDISAIFDKKNKIVDGAIAVILIYAVGIRVFQYLNNRNLWLDEASLALGIRDSSYANLLNPLDYGQVAPVGFIYLTKFFIELFGASERVLRLLPLITSIASVAIFYKLCRRYFPLQIAAVAIFIFAASPNLIYYSQEFKQYAVDVFFVLLLLLLYLNIKHSENRNRILFALFGCVASYFSHASIFVLAAISAHWILSSLRKQDRREILAGLLYGLIFAAFFFLNYFFFIHDNATKDSMQSFWEKSFLPLPSSFVNLEAWFWSFVSLYSYSGFSIFVSPFILFLCLIGMKQLFTPREELPQLCLITFLVLIFASLLGHYPFAGRLVLFAVPLFYVLVVYGLTIIWSAKKPITAIFFLLIVVASFSLHFARSFKPIERQEITGLLAHIQKHSHISDKVYIYYGANRAVKFYLGADFAKEPKYITGVTSRNDRSLYAEQLKGLAAYARVWILFSHVHQDEREFFVENFPMPVVESRQDTGAYLYLIASRK